MIIDDDVLDNKEDANILLRIKEFATEVMGVVPAAKQLLGLVERAVRFITPDIEFLALTSIFRSKKRRTICAL